MAKLGNGIVRLLSRFSSVLELATDALEGVRDAQRALLFIEVCPEQAECFTTAQSDGEGN